MAQPYLQQNYVVPAQPVWEDDGKHTFVAANSRLVDDQGAHEALPHTAVDTRMHRQPSVVKLEDEFSRGQMWHGRPHSPSYPAQHYPAANAPPMNTNPEHMARLYAQPYASTYGPPASAVWTMASASGSSTPTPLYGPVVDPMPVQFNSATSMFPYQQKGPGPVIMSPQSSQGGWASAASDDSGGHHAEAEVPTYRPMSPTTVQRSDGIRKKNARFDIPNHVNLATVEKLIKDATDEDVRKELKQQKRLLRNRQAALDSRSRKRLDMENLLREKKIWEQQQQEFTEEISRLKNVIDCERQQYETFIQGLTYERDEAIRLRTVETTETRRQNNFLKDYIKDMERQQATRGFGPTTVAPPFDANEFPSFGSLDLDDDTWEDEFSIIHGEDFRMDSMESPQRQLTPRPLPVSGQNQESPVTALDVPSTTDAGFSWNTFYICLLFGAYIASQQGSVTTQPSMSSSSGTQADASTNLPPLSEEYRVEANNVLKAVLSREDDAVGATVPSSLSNMNKPSMSHHRSSAGPERHQTSSLESLHAHLITTTRQQQGAAAFALTPDQYEHIVNPEGLPLRPAGQPDTVSPLTEGIPKPTPLQAMFATMQAERDEVERAVGLGGKARERSLILDRVPERVFQDFRRLVAEREGRTAGR